MEIPEAAHLNTAYRNSFAPVDDDLILPLHYKGKDYEFPFKMLTGGFGYRFAVLVNGDEIIFEKDDNGELRALLNNADAPADRPPDAELIGAIAETIQSLLS